VKPQTTVTSMVLGALLLASNRAGAAATLTELWAYGSSPSCSVEWTGNAGNGSWSTASNWSTHKVPGPTSDVCILTLATVDATPSISVHSIQVGESASLLFGSGRVSIATSLTNQGFITLFGTTLSSGSIDLPAPGEIDSYDNSSITSPAFSNTGTVSVGTGGTLRLADNPVQLQNGTLSGGNWLVAGALIVPSDISQLTTQGTVVSIDGTGSAVQDASGNNALATLTSVGSGAVLAVEDGASLTVAQGLTSQGVIDVGTGGSGGSLTVSGTYTQASGATTNMTAGSLSATSVSVQPGSTLRGNGTVASSIADNGTVAPQGSLTVTGNYTQTGGGALTEQFGSTLHVNLNATLSGALNVTVNPKHPPKSGATYTALTFGSLNGSFTRHTAGFTLTTSANSIQVTKQ
jgi:fibronectin-binding autotransporter adhesin